MITDAVELTAQELTRATALPAHFYVEAAAAELDRRAVFARGWQLVARADQVNGAGDHVVAELAGVPLLVVRGTDGVLRAVHNVCRHRAGPLAICDGRGAKRLHCRYHGWTYNLTGQLLKATEMTAAADFRVEGVHLPAARVAEWHGLVFACLDVDSPPLADVLAAITPRLAGRDLASYRFAKHTAYDIACNWKVYLDNYLEGYHVPHVHPELNRMLDYRDYVVDTARWSSLQSSPLDDANTVYGAGEALYWYVWPNTMLNVLPDRLQTNRVVPLDAQHCRVEFDYFYPPDVTDAVERIARDEAFSDLVQRQDVDICERVQRNLASGSYVAGRLNPTRENGVFHFHELLRAAYRADAARNAD